MVVSSVQDEARAGDRGKVMSADALAEEEADDVRDVVRAVALSVWGVGSVSSSHRERVLRRRTATLEHGASDGANFRVSVDFSEEEVDLVLRVSVSAVATPRERPATH